MPASRRNQDQDKFSIFEISREKKNIYFEKKKVADEKMRKEKSWRKKIYKKEKRIGKQRR